MLAEKHLTRNTVVIADPCLIENSSKILKKKIKLNILDDIDSKTLAGPSTINVLPINLRAKNMPGKLNPKNASYVIETIKKAADLCLCGES
jgi:4-hydroxythreonine-4-phosphate dehydrogenase